MPVFQRRYSCSYTLGLCLDPRKLDGCLRREVSPAPCDRTLLFLPEGFFQARATHAVVVAAFCTECLRKRNQHIGSASYIIFDSCQNKKVVQPRQSHNQIPPNRTLPNNKNTPTDEFSFPLVFLPTAPSRWSAKHFQYN